MNFEKSLARGKLAESKIARWLRLKGWTIIPVYEIEIGSGKGPQIYTPDNELIAPDLLAWKSALLRFIEVKNKSVFTRYRKSQKWQTGIDLHHYEHYLLVGEHFGLDIWLMFLHEQKTPDARDLAYDDCPKECPTGLFGNSLKILKGCVDHRDSRWAKGMVYWNKESLRPICSLDELNSPGIDTVFDHLPIRGSQSGSLFNDLA